MDNLKIKEAYFCKKVNNDTEFVKGIIGEKTTFDSLYYKVFDFESNTKKAVMVNHVKDNKIYTFMYDIEHKWVEVIIYEEDK